MVIFGGDGEPLRPVYHGVEPGGMGHGRPQTVWLDRKRGDFKLKAAEVRREGAMSWSVENTILMVRGGSYAYGLNTPDSDEDWRGVALPPAEWLIGFPPRNQAQQTVEHKTDGDVVIHTVAKFCALALKANPNTFDILFCREEDVHMQTCMGRELRQLRGRFLSRRVYFSFSGYAAHQLKRMRNHNTDHGAHRALVEQFGYDTKNAMHCIRLLKMAHTLLAEGRVEVYRPDQEFLLDIKRGRYSIAQVQAMAEELDHACLALRDRSVLPPEPDTAGIEAWLVDRQREWVNGGRSLLTPYEGEG